MTMPLNLEAEVVRMSGKEGLKRVKRIISKRIADGMSTDMAYEGLRLALADMKSFKKDPFDVRA